MGGKCYSKPRNSLQPPLKPSNFGGDIQTDLPTAYIPVPKISHAMNNDGVITLRDLGNEFEEPLFMQKKKKNLMDAFMKASDGDGSFPTETSASPVGLYSLMPLSWGRGYFKSQWGSATWRTTVQVPPQPASPAALLRIDSTGSVHIPRPEMITGHGLAAAISSLLGA